MIRLIFTHTHTQKKALLLFIIVVIWCNMSLSCTLHSPSWLFLLPSCIGTDVRFLKGFPPIVVTFTAVTWTASGLTSLTYLWAHMFSVSMSTQTTSLERVTMTTMLPAAGLPSCLNTIIVGSPLKLAGCLVSGYHFQSSFLLSSDGITISLVGTRQMVPHQTNGTHTRQMVPHQTNGTPPDEWYPTRLIVPIPDKWLWVPFVWYGYYLSGGVPFGNIINSQHAYARGFSHPVCLSVML